MNTVTEEAFLFLEANEETISRAVDEALASDSNQPIEDLVLHSFLAGARCIVRQRGNMKNEPELIELSDMA